MVSLAPGDYIVELNRIPGAWWSGPPVAVRWVEVAPVVVKVRSSDVAETELRVTSAQFLTVKLVNASPAVGHRNAAWARKFVVRVTETGGRILFQGTSLPEGESGASVRVPVRGDPRESYRVDVIAAGATMASRTVVGAAETEISLQ